MESGFNDAMHQALSKAWGVMIFVAVGLSAVAYRGWFRLYAIVTNVVLVGFGAASAIAIQGLEQSDTQWAGAFERINAYALMAWLVVLAVTVIRRSLRVEPVASLPTDASTGHARAPSLVAHGRCKPWDGDVFGCRQPRPTSAAIEAMQRLVQLHEEDRIPIAHRRRELPAAIRSLHV
jgi:hypothetical protein